MSELTTEHYRLLLGLDDSWVVESVDFQPADKRVVVSISHGGGKLFCPDRREPAHAIMERAVERGIAKRSTVEVHHVGIDEKSFGQGHDNISVMTDLDGHRVLDVAEGRTIEATDRLWETLPAIQRKKVRAVAMDMWEPFMNSTGRQVPDAEIVHDKFHVVKYLNNAVDQVRRRENKLLRESDDDRLTGTKQLWLYAKKNLTRKRLNEIKALQDDDLKTSRAWALKENFRWFWRYVYSTSAEDYFEKWYQWVEESKLGPVIKVANMLKRHLRWNTI